MPNQARYRKAYGKIPKITAAEIQKTPAAPVNPVFGYFPPLRLLFSGKKPDRYL